MEESWEPPRPKHSENIKCLASPASRLLLHSDRKLSHRRRKKIFHFSFWVSSLCLKNVLMFSGYKQSEETTKHSSAPSFWPIRRSGLCAVGGGRGTGRKRAEGGSLPYKVKRKLRKWKCFTTSQLLSGPEQSCDTSDLAAVSGIHLNPETRCSAPSGGLTGSVFRGSNLHVWTETNLLFIKVSHEASDWVCLTSLTWCSSREKAAVPPLTNDPDRFKHVKVLCCFHAENQIISLPQSKMTKVFLRSDLWPRESSISALWAVTRCCHLLAFVFCGPIK